MRIALITGASSGLGREFARQIDRTEKNIDEIWLLARRKERLQETADELQHAARVLPLDLTRSESFDLLKEELLDAQVQVGVLANCAGYAKIGNYAKVSRYDTDHMIDLNCRAAVDVTLTALDFMKQGDRIIEICSTAAFQPLQHFNIYAASKAFLYNYSRALRMELLPRRISVTAVCPFWIRDTEFISVARDNKSNQDTKKAIRHFYFSVTAERVVRQSLRDSRAGLAVCTPGVFCFIHRIFSKLIPREALLYFWELLRRV